jgi:uncharacterized protein
MVNAFWDTSAVVPLCVAEESSDLARKEWPSGIPSVWWATHVEALSGIHRRAKAGLPAEHRDAAVQILRGLSEQWDEVEPSEHVRALAMELLERFDLRAADALQLAAALVWCNERPRNRRFVCNDQGLSGAARALGFDVVSFNK